MTISIEQAVGIDQVKTWKDYISILAKEKGVVLSDRQTRKYLQERIKMLLQSYTDFDGMIDFLGDEYIN